MAIEFFESRRTDLAPCFESLAESITRFFNERRERLVYEDDDDFSMLDVTLNFQEGYRFGSVEFVYNPTTRQLVIYNVTLDRHRIGPRNAVDSCARTLLLTVPEIDSVLLRSVSSAYWCRRLIDSGWLPVGDNPYIDVTSESDLNVVLVPPLSASSVP